MSEGAGRLDDADGSLSLLLWRQALAGAARVPRVDDLEAWIDHLGATTATTPLERCVAVLRSDRPAALPCNDEGRWTVAAAFDDLRALARDVGGTMTLDNQREPHPAFPNDSMPNTAGKEVSRDTAALADDFLSALGSTGADADRRLVVSLAELCELYGRFPQLDYRDYRHSPLPTLVGAIAVIVLCDFALRTRDLWAAPYGSATLMRVAAGLGATELGGYCGKVGLIARSSADIYDMARIAVATSTNAPADAREAWICFLCRDAGDDLLLQVIDDLGDVAASRPLAMILRIVADRIDSNVALLWRLRDAAIDYGDLRLAARAQRRVADARDQEGGELLILGTLYAMAGEGAAAAATFRELVIRQWPGAAERLAALRTGGFEPYRIDQGYTSPLDRQATRLHRRGVAPGYSRVRGQRINAVDVG